MADLTVYTKETEASFLSNGDAENGSFTVSSFWLGDRLSGLQVVQISGTLSEDAVWCLSELEIDWSEPTVIFIHTQMMGGAFSLVELDEHGVSAMVSEQYTVSEEAFFFACYATSDTVRLQIGETSSGVYRLMIAERLSAF